MRLHSRSRIQSGLSCRLFLHILSAILLTSGPQGVLAAADEQTADLSVMSFNIRYGTANDGENHWEKRHEQVFGVMGQYDCDVVGLQEALRFQIDQIREALPQYGEIGVGRDDGKTKGEYSGILYRKNRLKVTDSGTFWLSDTPEVVGSTSWGNTITRICTWGRFVQRRTGKPFYIFNVHLDHRSQPSREKSAVLLAQRIRDREYNDPVIVTGDFNAGEKNPAIRYLKGDFEQSAAEAGLRKNPVPLVDTFRVLHPEATEVGTFNSWRGERSGEKIDYVFALPGADILEAMIIFNTPGGRCPSDHFPVMARFSLVD